MQKVKAKRLKKTEEFIEERSDLADGLFDENNKQMDQEVEKKTANDLNYFTQEINVEDIDFEE